MTFDRQRIHGRQTCFSVSNHCLHNNPYLCWLEPNFSKSDNRIRRIKKNVSNSKRNAATHSRHFQVGDSAIFGMHWLILFPKRKGRFRSEDLLDSFNLYFKLELKRKKKITFLQILYRSIFVFIYFHLHCKCVFKIFSIVTLYEILSILKSKFLI